MLGLPLTFNSKALEYFKLLISLSKLCGFNQHTLWFCIIFTSHKIHRELFLPRKQVIHIIMCSLTNIFILSFPFVLFCFASSPFFSFLFLIFWRLKSGAWTHPRGALKPSMYPARNTFCCSSFVASFTCFHLKLFPS